MELIEAASLVAGGAIAGIVNTLAGGGSLLTVPLLVWIGLPGNLANGTNRVGVAVAAWIASARFSSEGVASWRDGLPVLALVCAGSVVGSTVVGALDDATFERLFGFVMLLLAIPMLRPSPGADASRAVPGEMSWGSWLLFFAVGFYGGAIQAGVGVALLFALSRAGYDLVRANAVKMMAVLALTLAALPSFAARDQIDWPAATLLAAGFAAGGEAGARLAIRGGEALIRPVLALAILAIAGRMLGIY